MKVAFERYKATTDSQDDAMQLRSQRIREFNDAYGEAIKLLHV